MSDDGAYTQQYLDAAGDAAEGTYMSFVAGDSRGGMDDFVAKYMDKFGVAPAIWARSTASPTTPSR